MFSKTVLFSALALFSSTLAAPALDSHEGHSHVSYSRDQAAVRDWHQDPNSETAQLFKRAPGTPGSPEWQAAYPAPGTTPPTSGIPKAWLDRLYSVTNSSTFPKFGPSLPNNGYPTYANGLSGTSSEVCSFTYECVSEEDLVNAPDGVVGLNFDDGPTPFSPPLYDFIEKNNISATHFMIGGNIFYNIESFQRAVRDGGHIASHTWSHPYMTTLSNEQIVAELGWTSQIIADLNGGRVPAYWRPPFGDADNRVRTIALQVFGLRTVPWQIGRDSQDWSVSDTAPGKNSRQSVIADMTSWLTDPARKGYIGLHQADLDIFMAIYPIMISNKWNVVNVAEASSMWDYVNAQNNDSPILGPTDIVQTAAPGALTTYSAMQGSIGSTSAASSAATSSAASSSSSTASSGSVVAQSGASSSSSSTSTRPTTAATTPSTVNNNVNAAGIISPSSMTGLISLLILTFALMYQV